MTCKPAQKVVQYHWWVGIAPYGQADLYKRLRCANTVGVFFFLFLFDSFLAVNYQACNMPLLGIGIVTGEALYSMVIVDARSAFCLHGTRYDVAIFAGLHLPFVEVRPLGIPRDIVVIDNIFHREYRCFFGCVFFFLGNCQHYHKHHQQRCNNNT